MASISGQSTTNIDGVDGFYTTQGGGSGTTTTTPTVAVADNYGLASATVTNYASYTSVVFQCEVYVGTTLIVSNANTTKVAGVISWADNSTLTGSRTVKVKAQEFGDFIQSAIGSDTYTKLATTFRYFRCRCVTSTGANSSLHMGIRDWRYTSATPTDYPANMTADALPTPYVASAGHYYGNYSPYKAFDAITSSWAWTLTTNATNNWIQIDMGSTLTMVSGEIMFYNGSSAEYFTISGSTDGVNFTVLQDTIAVDKTSSYINL